MSSTHITRTHSIQNGRFRVRTIQAGSGSPLIFLHDIMGFDGDWLPFLAPLTERFTVIIPELPGYGESSGAEHLDGVLDLIVYQLDLLDALGLERFDLVGHDLGGMIAAELAVVAGKRIDRLVLCAPYGLWSDDAPVLDIFATPTAELPSHVWHDPALAQSPPSVDDDEARMAAIARARGLSTATRFLWPIPDRGLRNRLHRVTQPTLVVWGDDDRVIPSGYADEFMALLPNARLELIPECGHLPMYEQPEHFTNAITDFLGGPAS